MEEGMASALAMGELELDPSSAMEQRGGRNEHDGSKQTCNIRFTCETARNII
jgi:hypothetical protein